eukprot:scaffold2.g6961.t1
MGNAESKAADAVAAAGAGAPHPSSDALDGQAGGEPAVSEARAAALAPPTPAARPAAAAASRVAPPPTRAEASPARSSSARAEAEERCVGRVVVRGQELVWRLDATDLPAGASSWRCVSKPFAVPPASLPRAYAGMLAGQQWCLVCEPSGTGSPPGLSLLLRSLGGMDARGLEHAAVCCRLRAEARWRRSGLGHGSHSQAAQESSPEPAEPASPLGSSTEAGSPAAVLSPHAAGPHCADAGRAPGAGGDECGLLAVAPPPAPLSGDPDAPAAERAAAGGGGASLEIRLAFDAAAGGLPGVVAPAGSAGGALPGLLLKVSRKPQILVADGFLSPAECAEVQELGAPRLRPSKVSSGDQTNLRTSWGMFVTGELTKHPTARRLERRLQAGPMCPRRLLCGSYWIDSLLVTRDLADLAAEAEGRRRLTLGEATQIVRYFEGEQYAAHYDNRVGDTVRRAATVMVYLSDLDEGGTTSFPRSPGLPRDAALEARGAGVQQGGGAWAGEWADGAPGTCAPARPSPGATAAPAAGALEGEEGSQKRPLGLSIVPKQGRAIIFWSRLPDGGEDVASLHAADPVGPGGTKWVATRWCREME